MTSELATWLDAFLREPTFLAKYPYYVAILAKMSPVADPSVTRMAVSLHAGRFYLHINVDAFLAEPQYLRGVLLHEVHHVVLGHLTHPKFEIAAEPELMDLALETSANEYIEEPLPNPIVWRAYAAAGMRAGQSTIERYETLVAHLRTTGARPRPAPGSGGTHGTPGPLDDHRFLRQGERLPGGVPQTESLVRDALENANPSSARDDERPEGSALIAGRAPGRLLEELSGRAERPEDYIDWKAALRMFVARARAPVHTYARPSRRFPNLVGLWPGRHYVPRLLTKPRLLVAIDTSLSMSSKELAEVGRQLGEMAKQATLIIAECDVEIARMYPFSGTLSHVAGRGGTDLRPVFDPEVLGATKADGVIYFTDGDGPVPDDPPPRPTLWILTKPHEFHCRWGHRSWLGRAYVRPLPPPISAKPRRKRT
jgi:predicted metal-dependent peptidase